MKVLVTGAGGFIGRAVCPAIQAYNYDVVGLVRSVPCDISDVPMIRVALEDIVLLAQALVDVQCVVHLAGRAHKLSDDVVDPLAEFRAVNCDATLQLARLAIKAGVKRFIFISSIGVNGSSNNKPFTSECNPEPTEPYAQSKWEAEKGLWDIFRGSDAQLVIIRPPLVYGPNAPGNFARLIKTVNKAIPLPFGAIHNRRSLVALDNLVDLIVTCIDHPSAANQTFLVSDGEDLSTTELLRKMGEALGKPARLLPVPSWMLEAGATMLGKKALSRRLCGSLQVDISKTRELLNWTPPVSVDEALRRTAKHFLEQQAK